MQCVESYQVLDNDNTSRLQCAVDSRYSAEHVAAPVRGPAAGGEGGLPAGGQGVHRGHQESGGGRKWP